METPYLYLIAYPTIYPFWLIPVRLETSRQHIFFWPSRAISVISNPESVKADGCGACDVQDPCRHLHEIRGRSWLCMVEEVVVPPHCMLCCSCTGLSHWIRAPTVSLEAEDEWQLTPPRLPTMNLQRLNYARTVRCSYMSGGRKLICRWCGRQLFFYYQDRLLSSIYSCSMSPYLDTALFLLSALLSKDAPIRLSPAVPEYFSPSLNADLLYNKTRCIQGQPSDVAAVIVLHKSGTDTNLCPQWGKWW